MAHEVVPLDSSPRQSLLVNLGGQEVALEVWWAPLAAVWYMTLDVNGERVAGGRQMSSRSRLIRDRRFVGDLYVTPPSGEETAEAPGRTDWEPDRFRLLYLTPADVAEADRWI